MAEIQQTQQMAAPGRTTSIAKATNLLGAAASLALLVGVGVWSYQIVMRDVSGVPVVRAAEGPFRVQPDDPGGQQAQNQGLSVNDVAAEGTAADPADRLVLAPAPLDLTVEDELPVTATAGDAPGTQDFAAEDDASDMQAGFADAGEEQIQLAAVERLAAQLAEGVMPLEELQPADTEETVEAPASAIEEAVAEAARVEGGLGRSLRPRERPVGLSNIQTVAAVASPDGGADIDPATIPAGTRLAQLGAYDSAETARKEWDRIESRFGEYLEGKDRVVQKATSGGRTFYRLRAMGFADLSDARRFCSALVAENAECIPVVTR